MVGAELSLSSTEITDIFISHYSWNICLQDIISIHYCFEILIIIRSTTRSFFLGALAMEHIIIKKYFVFQNDWIPFNSYIF